MADIEWQKNGFILPKESDIISDSEYNATSTSNSDVTTVLGKLTWKREFRNSDEGEYECIVHQRNSTSLKAVSQTIELEAVTVTMHPVTDRPWTVCRSNVSERVMYFQIRTVGVDCHNWMEPLKELITTEVHHELLQAVEDECHCAVDDRELRLIGVPQCSIQMDDAAVFHGVIQTNSLEKTRLIYCALSVWLQRSGQIEIDGRFQAIDPSCSLEATDALSEECAPLVEEVTPSSENNAKEIRILAIAGGIGGFITIVVLLITIVCCIGCYYQLRTRNLKSKRDEGVHGSKGVDHTYDQ